MAMRIGQLALNTARFGLSGLLLYLAASQVLAGIVMTWASVEVGDPEYAPLGLPVIAGGLVTGASLFVARRRPLLGTAGVILGPLTLVALLPVSLIGLVGPPTVTSVGLLTVLVLAHSPRPAATGPGATIVG
jgi:hypothetical protein